MPPQATAPPALEVREVQLRAETEPGKREFTGIAVPYGDPVTIRGWFGNYTEEIASGAVEHEDDVKVFWRHDEVIGRITRGEDTDAGWEVTGVLSDTTLGRDAYALLKDGAIDRMSIGFEPIEHTEREDDDGLHITRTRIRVREVSLVPFPAYDGATVAQVRSRTNPEKEKTMPEAQTPVLTPEQVRDWGQKFEDLTRGLDLVNEKLDRAEQDEKDLLVLRYATPGALLKAIAAGDQDAVREYQAVQQHVRDWNPAGTTTADTVTKDAWVGDLTRLIEERRTLRTLFSTGALPAEGNNIEYGQLLADTTSVTEQVDEGDTLAFGKVTFETATAPVKTYGGYTRLSLQAIQRSSIATLDHHIRALNLAAERRRNIAFRAHYATAVAAQVTAGNTVEVPTTGADYVDWFSAIVDAAELFEDLALDIDTLVVGKADFKELAALTATDGRPLMTVHGTGTNVVGDLNLPGITGNLAGVPVVPNLKQAAPGAAFVNRLAIRSYASPVAQLQDEDIINLSRDFSVYYYEALADELPAAIVPVERTGA